MSLRQKPDLKTTIQDRIIQQILGTKQPDNVWPEEMIDQEYYVPPKQKYPLPKREEPRRIPNMQGYAGYRSGDYRRAAKPRVR
jgi:hypothetical protein